MGTKGIIVRLEQSYAVISEGGLGQVLVYAPIDTCVTKNARGVKIDDLRTYLKIADEVVYSSDSTGADVVSQNLAKYHPNLMYYDYKALTWTHTGVQNGAVIEATGIFGFVCGPDIVRDDFAEPHKRVYSNALQLAYCPISKLKPVNASDGSWIIFDATFSYNAPASAWFCKNVYATDKSGEPELRKHAGFWETTKPVPTVVGGIYNQFGTVMATAWNPMIGRIFADSSVLRQGQIDAAEKYFKPGKRVLVIARLEPNPKYPDLISPLPEDRKEELKIGSHCVTCNAQMLSAGKMTGKGAYLVNPNFGRIFMGKTDFYLPNEPGPLADIMPSDQLWRVRMVPFRVSRGCAWRALFVRKSGDEGESLTSKEPYKPKCKPSTTQSKSEHPVSTKYYQVFMQSLPVRGGIQQLQIEVDRALRALGCNTKPPDAVRARIDVNNRARAYAFIDLQSNQDAVNFLKYCYKANSDARSQVYITLRLWSTDYELEVEAHKRIGRDGTQSLVNSFNTDSVRQLKHQVPATSQQIEKISKTSRATSLADSSTSELSSDFIQSIPQTFSNNPVETFIPEPVTQSTNVPVVSKHPIMNRLKSSQRMSSPPMQTTQETISPNQEQPIQNTVIQASSINNSPCPLSNTAQDAESQTLPSIEERLFEVVTSDPDILATLMKNNPQLVHQIMISSFRK